MMKSKISIVLLSFVFILSCSSKKNWQTLIQDPDSVISNFDVEFIDYVLSGDDLGLIKKEKFEFLNSFSEMYKIKDEAILISRFMEKPSKNELLSIYLRRKIAWNSFNIGSAKLSKEEIVFNELKNFPSEHEMLSFYYSEIFIQVLNNKRTINPNNIDLSYSKLGLNQVEGDILFLTAMRHCGSQINSFSTANFPSNCFRAFEFVSKLPTFNGDSFLDYELSEFEDFEIHVDKRYPKMSFKERYLPEFENAKMSYTKCLENEDDKN